MQNVCNKADSFVIVSFKQFNQNLCEIVPGLDINKRFYFMLFYLLMTNRVFMLQSLFIMNVKTGVMNVIRETVRSLLGLTYVCVMMDMKMTYVKLVSSLSPRSRSQRVLFYII